MTTAADITNCQTNFTRRMAVATKAFGATGHDRDIAREQGLKQLDADLAALFEADYKAANLTPLTAQNLKSCRAIFDQHMAAAAAAFPNGQAEIIRVQAQVSAAFQKYVGIVLAS